MTCIPDKVYKKDNRPDLCFQIYLNFLSLSLRFSITYQTAGYQRILFLTSIREGGSWWFHVISFFHIYMYYIPVSDQIVSIIKERYMLHKGPFRKYYWGSDYSWGVLILPFIKGGIHSLPTFRRGC